MVTIDIKVFKDMVARCSSTSTKDENRFELQYTNIEVEPGKLKMWSMNGYQVQIVELKIDDVDSFKASFSNIYIPSKDMYVEVSRHEDILSLTYQPSGLQLNIPQRNAKLFDINDYTQNIAKKKDFVIAIGRQKLENALKKSWKTHSKDVLILRLNTTSSLFEIEVINEHDNLKQTSYILPVSINAIESYKDKLEEIK